MNTLNTQQLERRLNQYGFLNIGDQVYKFNFNYYYCMKFDCMSFSMKKSGLHKFLTRVTEFIQDEIKELR